MSPVPNSVAPAEAGVQGSQVRRKRPWVPAFAGMTKIGAVSNVRVHPLAGQVDRDRPSMGGSGQRGTRVNPGKPCVRALTDEPVCRLGRVAPKWWALGSGRA